MSCKNTRRLGFPGCYRHVVKGKDVNIKPMVIPQAPLKISMEHEAAMKPLKEDFCFGNGMGRVSMFFFWSFGSHTSIPYLFNRWVLSCFMCKLDIKKKQRSFNKNRLPFKTAGHLQNFLGWEFPGCYGNVHEHFSWKWRTKMAETVRPRARKKNRDLYFWK